MAASRSSRKRAAFTLDDEPDEASSRIGSVERVRLINFMTYTDIVMNPAPFLNLIVAPNGSGKSALVCGMIVGLAGDVSLTGRSGNLSDYVKFGCDSGSTDIELKASSGRNYRIQRKLNKTTKDDGSFGCRSEWMLNGKNSTEKEVKAFVKNLNIAIDNLCQCLPQERVVEFVKMNSKELLQNTEKAVGDVSLFNDHQQLIDLSERVKSLLSEKEKLSGKTMEKEKQNERDEEEIKRLEEKKKVREEIRALELKKPWLVFEEKRKEFVAIRTQCESLLKKKKKEESLIEPFRLRVEQNSAKVKHSEKIISKYQNDIEAAASSSKKLFPRLNQSVKKADELQQEFKNKVSENSNRQGQIVALKSKIRDTENDLNNRESADSLQQRISILDSKMAAANTAITELTSRKDSLASELGRMVDLLKKEQNLLQSLDAGNRRRQLLRQLSYPAFNGLQVLEEMIRANAFSESVYPPMMMVIDVDDLSKAKFVESCIQKRDLFAFVFEDDGDLIKFSQEIAGRNIRCALIQKPPLSNRPLLPTSRLRRLGFDALVSDLFRAPQAVKDCICVNSNVDMIPVGDESASTRFNECDQMGIRSFFAGSYRYTMMKSRYDQSVVTTSQPVQDAKILTIKVDTASVESAEQKISELEEQISAGKSESDAISDDLDRKVDEKTKIREEKKVHANELQDVRQLQASVSMRREELKAKESNTFDEVTEKAHLLTALRFETQKSGKVMDELVSLTGTCTGMIKQKHLDSSHLITLRELLTVAKKHSDRAGARLKNLEQELSSKEQVRNEMKAEAKQLRHEAEQKVLNAGHKMKNNELPSSLRKLFDELPDEVHELDAKLQVLYLKKHSMTGIESESAVQDFENRKREIAENREQLRNLSADLERRQSELETVKDRWIRPLKQLMQQIDENFSRAMKRMGHAGDVQLRGEGNEFREYGIVIRVKYRDSESLQELSAYHQSGGERSVATVIYMMALQELTKVPFRCIDEINQGMDAANERKVFDLIVETAMKNSSQYFLLSPKLLLGLTYSDKMQIHCIHNGRSISNDFIQNV